MGGGGEISEGPAFGGAVFGSGAEGEAQWLLTGVVGWGGEVIAQRAEQSGVVDGGAAIFGDAEKMVDVMAERAGAGGWDDLIEQAVAPSSAIADAAWDAAAGHLEGAARGFDHHDGDVIPDAGGFDEPMYGEDTVFGRAGIFFDDGIDLTDIAPEVGEFGGCEHGEAGIGASSFQGADSRHGHAGVSEPVGGTDEDFEWLEVSGGHAGWVFDAALVMSEQKIRSWCFPSVVNPEPIGGREADEFFQLAVQGGS